MAKKEKVAAKPATIASKAADKVAGQVLNLNPDVKEVYVTSDGVAFYTRNDAQNHANTLKNRELFRRTRGEGAAEDAEEQQTEQQTEQKTETGEE